MTHEEIVKFNEKYNMSKAVHTLMRRMSEKTGIELIKVCISFYFFSFLHLFIFYR